MEYEGLHLVCFACGRYGHRKEQCQGKIAAEQGREQAPAATTGLVEGQAERETPTEAFGP